MKSAPDRTSPRRLSRRGELGRGRAGAGEVRVRRGSAAARGRPSASGRG